MDAIPPLPAPSGSRLGGDDYQHLLTWLHAVKLFRGRDGVTRIELEAHDAGNVDDLVVHREGHRPIYHQVKFGVDALTPLTHEWFTTAATASGRTPVQRFWASYTNLAALHGQPPEMALYTSKPLSGGDPVLRHRSGNDATVAQRLAAALAGSDSGKVRAAWAMHLGVSEEELLGMLADLRIEAGEPSIRHLTDSCALLMELCQLQHDAKAVLAGCGRMRQLVREGHRILDADAVAALVDELELHADAPSRGLLVIEAIDHRPSLKQAATITLDWVDLFDGGAATVRRQLHDPAGWENELHPQLRTAAHSLRALGLDDVLLDGAMGLSTGLAAGAALRGVTGFTVAIRNPTTRQEWGSSGQVTTVTLTRADHELGDGNEVAIALAISGDPSEDVEEYLRRNRLEVGRLVVLSPPGGSGRHAVADDAAARGLAVAAVDAMREVARAHARVPLHLFQYGPLALSVLVGHAWNRLPATTLYDDLASADLYAPTFYLPA
jgi:hypothetical protein